MRSPHPQRKGQQDGHEASKGSELPPSGDFPGSSAHRITLEEGYTNVCVWGPLRSGQAAAILGYGKCAACLKTTEEAQTHTRTRDGFTRSECRQVSEELV